MVGGGRSNGFPALRQGDVSLNISSAMRKASQRIFTVLVYVCSVHATVATRCSFSGGVLRDLLRAELLS